MLTKWTKNKSALDDQIDDVHEQLALEEVDSERHSQLMSVLERLYKIKKEQTSEKVDANTKAVIAGNLLGIALILNHERLHVVSSKALGFVMKSKM